MKKGWIDVGMEFATVISRHPVRPEEYGMSFQRSLPFEPMTLESPLSVLKPHLSNRAYGALVKEQFKTIGDVCACTEAFFLATHHFGQKSLNTLKEVLAQHGLSLAKE
jgi:DNA-directed RNA polymerase alpha subunit